MNLEQLCSSRKEDGKHCSITMIFPNGKLFTCRAVWVDPAYFKSSSISLVLEHSYCTASVFVDIDAQKVYEIAVQPTGTMLISSQHGNSLYSLDKEKGVSSFDRLAMLSKLRDFLPKQVAAYKSLVLINPDIGDIHEEIPF